MANIRGGQEAAIPCLLRASVLALTLTFATAVWGAVPAVRAAESAASRPAKVSPAPPAPVPSPSSSPAVTFQPGAGLAIPVWAYYYIWFDPSSWNRAKSDAPLLGEYSSDERAIMRKHVALAKSAGIDGFLVSWKDTGKLSNRLSRLAGVAQEMDFHLGLVYQGLDFARRPIEVRQVCADLATFADKYATNPVFHLHGDKPVVVWTGTDQYSSADLERCVAPVRDRLTVLASSRSVKEWERASAIFAGSAYYWSSVNPEKSWYPRQLAAMGDAVHASGGLWVAPAAPGFDARLVGGKSVVSRDNGRALGLELEAAVASAPDAIGLISWNEFTENSQIEPSKRYGSSALQTLSQFTGTDAAVPELDSSAPAQRPAASGFNGVAALIIMGAILGAVLIWSRWRREPAPLDDHGPLPSAHDDHAPLHGDDRGADEGPGSAAAPDPADDGAPDR